MDFNYAATQADIHDMIRYQNENHHHYFSFYQEMCDLWDFEYEVDGATWFQSRGQGRGRGY